MGQKSSLTKWFRNEETPAWVDNWLCFDRGRRNKKPSTIKKLKKLGFFNLPQGTDLVGLELGCATGNLLQVTSGLGYRRVYGIELIEQFIHQANNKEKIVNASCTCLPFKSDRFDLVITLDTLHHLYSEEWAQCVQEVQRVCKNGGYWLVREPRDCLGEKLYTYFTQRFFPARWISFFKYMRILKAQEWHVYQTWLKSADDFFALLNQEGFHLVKNKDLINFYLICKVRK